MVIIINRKHDPNYHCKNSNYYQCLPLALLSTFCFFSVGLMIALFISDEKVRDELMMCMRIGVSSWRQFFKRKGGIGSRQQNLFGILENRD